MLAISIALIALGISMLYVGADYFVRGASSLAVALRVSPLIVGLTVVAFGTTSPELAVNIFSALQGSSDLALGNVIGSNISNILLILGLSAFVGRITIQGRTAVTEIPFLIAISVIFALLALDPFSSQTALMSTQDGVILLILLSVFLAYMLLLARKDRTRAKKIKAVPLSSSILLGTGGLIVLLIGAKILVDNAVLLARFAGMSETLIGLTIVAIGTSLPELATAITAVVKKQSDIAVGNIIGSNILNLLWISGLTSIIRPLTVTEIIQFDLMVNIAIGCILLFMLLALHRNKLSRSEGTILLSLYLAYLLYIITRG